MDFYIACVTKLRALHALGAQLPNRNVFLHHSIHITSTEILLFSQLCIDFVFYIIQQLNNIIFQILMSLKQLEIFQNLLKCNHEKDLLNIHMTHAWRIPGTVEPGGLQSMGSHRVGHD